MAAGAEASGPTGEGQGQRDQASDTPDKIDFEKLARVAAFVRDLALGTANAPEPPRVLPRPAWAGWTWPSPVPGGPLAATH